MNEGSGSSDDRRWRPSTYARLSLARVNATARPRARDQQADRAGEALRRDILARLAELDPEPDQFEECLLTIVESFAQISGPARSLAATIRDEWIQFRDQELFRAYLLTQAIDSEPRKRPGSSTG